MNVKRVFGAFAAGLAAAATTTALAADFEWRGAAGDGLWSTPGNWVNTVEGLDVPSTKLPTSSDMVYLAKGYDNTISLTEDVSIDALVQFADYATIAGNGHKLSVARSAGSDERVAKDLIFSGTNSVLEFKGTTTAYYFYDPKENGVWAKDGASISFSKVSLAKNGKFKATNGGKVTLPSAAMAEAMRFEADGAGSEITFANTSTTKNSKIKAVNGGKVTLNSLNATTAGQVIDVASNGVLVVKGALNNTKAWTFNLSGSKPTGGFIQITGGETSFGGTTTVNMTPDASWSDSTSVGAINYTYKSGYGTLWDDCPVVIDLINFQDMDEYATVKICLFHTDGKMVDWGKGQALEPKKSYKNREGLNVYCDQSADKRSVYITVNKHNWSPWTVVKAPTKHAAGKRVRHCTDAGCTKVHEESIAKLEHDYLQIDQTNSKAESDAAGYFQTAYTPHLKNTTVELVASPSTNLYGRSLILAGTEAGNFMYIFANCEAVSGAKSLHAYVTDVDGGVENFSASYEGVEPKMTYTFGGGKFTVNGVTTSMTNAVKDVYADTTLMFFKHSDYQWTGGVRVYSIKVTEKVEGNDVVKMWLVPGMNGTQATLLDLVNGEYLKPINAKNFYLGDDPVTGFKMYVR